MSISNTKFTVILALVLVWTGCSDNPQSESGDARETPDAGKVTDAPADFRLKCSAYTTGGTKATYTIAGDTLEFATVGSPKVKLKRVASGTGDKAIFGSWGADVPVNPEDTKTYGLRGEVLITFEAGRFTIKNTCFSKWAKPSVQATSPSEITDTTFNVLESHRESRTWTAAEGEQLGE